MKFRCDCSGHILEIEDFSIEGTKGISIEIYDIYSPKGYKYKKPRPSADVVILNNKYKHEYDKLIKFFKKTK